MYLQVLVHYIIYLNDFRKLLTLEITIIILYAQGMIKLKLFKTVQIDKAAIRKICLKNVMYNQTNYKFEDFRYCGAT